MSWVQLWRGERRWLLLRLLCALIWAGELFWVQGLPFSVVPWIQFPALVQSFRFGLDLVVTTSLVLLLRRRFLIVLLVWNVVAVSVVGTYAIHFHWPLMPVRVSHQLPESKSLVTMLHGLLSAEVLTVVLAALVVKLFLLSRSGNYLPSAKFRRLSVLVAFLLYLLPIGTVQLTHHLTLWGKGTIGRGVYAYGYALPWICDLLSNRDLATHLARARELQERNYDRLASQEAPFSIPNHLVILQLESVDTHALEARCEGAAVMPFLLGLKDQGMYYRIRAFHRNGSCDMDYAATTFTEPYPGMVPYRLPGLQYPNAMPGFMERHGFKTYIFHGNTEFFFDRGVVMEQLGFDHRLFKEELASRKLPTSAIGVRDAAVFRCALEVFKKEARAYVFVITLDTHSPYATLAPGEMELFPEPKEEVHRYFNSLRYLDNCLRDFVEGLPVGTTLVCYGDHTASIFTETFNSDVVDGNEYVGCVIYQKGTNLARTQQTRDKPLALNGSLNLLDILSYLRRSTETMGNPARYAKSSAVNRSSER